MMVISGAPKRPTPFQRTVEVLPQEQRTIAAQRIHVVLPLFNEAACAPDVVEQVLQFAAGHPDYSFTFVDDGSSDGTRAALESALAHAGEDLRSAVRRVRILGYATNAGKGFAVMRGIASLEGSDDDLVIFTDGDLAYSLDHLPRLATALQNAEVVIGSRRAPDGGYRAHLARNLMGWAYNKIARLCLGVAYRDTQAGIKGFRLAAAKRIFGALRVMGFAFDVEVLYLARRFGFRIAEVAVTVSPHHRGKGSNVNLLRDPRRMLVSLAGIRVSGALGQYERPAQGRRPLALMSFDVEEFDAPQEFGHPISPEDQIAVGAEGLRRALRALDEVPARATLFVTAALAQAEPGLIREARRRGHEIASHGYTHSRFDVGDLERSRTCLERISGSAVRGFRRARFAHTDPKEAKRSGYQYDSSVNPIWMPGRYNGWRHPRRAYERDGLLVIPASATPIVRFPLFWLAFKNCPQWMYRVATRWVLAADGYAALCFHPWELCDLRHSGLPMPARRIDGRSMEARLIRYLRWLSRRADMVTYGELTERWSARAWPFSDRVAPAPGLETAINAPGATVHS
jgi:hypothetical protein